MKKDQLIDTRLATPIPDNAQLINFGSTFNFCKFVSTCKNEAALSICSDLKIMQSDWLRAFQSISQEQDFSQILDLYGNKNINFHYRTNSMKSNIQIFL